MIDTQLNGKSILLFLAAALAVFLPVNSQAETRYISDQLVINIRDNLQQPYTVVAKVRSNDAVIVLEENDTYARVETAQKQVGWIAKQYLTSTVPKTLEIEKLKKEIESLRTQSTQGAVMPAASAASESELQDERNRLQLELQSAQARIAELQDAMLQQQKQPTPADSETLSAEIKGLEEKRNQLETEITTLRAQAESLNDGRIDFDGLMQEKERLQKDNEAKDLRIISLTAENNKLAKQTTIYWFCAGALVFIAGMLAGKMFGRKKAKYSY